MTTRPCAASRQPGEFIVVLFCLCQININVCDLFLQSVCKRQEHGFSENDFFPFSCCHDCCNCCCYHYYSPLWFACPTSAVHPRAIVSNAVRSLEDDCLKRGDMFPRQTHHDQAGADLLVVMVGVIPSCVSAARVQGSVHTIHDSLSVGLCWEARLPSLSLRLDAGLCWEARLSSLSLRLDVGLCWEARLLSLRLHMLQTRDSRFYCISDINTACIQAVWYALRMKPVVQFILSFCLHPGM